MGEAERQDGPAVTGSGSQPKAGDTAETPVIPPADDQAAATGQAQPAEAPDRTPEDIEREIEQTREELGDTVAALAQKTDVKERAKDKVQGVKQTVADKKDEVVEKAQEKKEEFASKAQDATPSSFDTDQVTATARDTAQKPPVLAGAVLVAGILIGLTLRRRRRRRRR